MTMNRQSQGRRPGCGLIAVLRVLAALVSAVLAWQHQKTVTEQLKRIVANTSRVETPAKPPGVAPPKRPACRSDGGRCRGRLPGGTGGY
jgi:hypothetical protein